MHEPAPAATSAHVKSAHCAVGRPSRGVTMLLELSLGRSDQIYRCRIKICRHWEIILTPQSNIAKGHATATRFLLSSGCWYILIARYLSRCM